MKRVVVTGMSAITPIGNTWAQAYKQLSDGASGIQFMPQWSDIQGMASFLAAPVTLPSKHSVPRKLTRSMSRVSLIAAQTAEHALQLSRLNINDTNREDIGIAYGSSFGSAAQLVPFGRVLSERQVRGISPTAYIKLMGHTAAVNLSLLMGIRGRLIPTSAACASGGQAIGYAYETIQHGLHPVMIAGSADELSPMQTAVFDSFFAASREHDSPSSAVRPFSADRAGMVVGEGGATFILEDLEFALNRGAPVLAEIVGFATNLDGHHIIKQDEDMMRKVILRALQSANLSPEQIGYINAHATGTESDSVEAGVLKSIFGNNVPVASSKGHIGHGFGGGSAIEIWLSVNMMNEGWFAPTLNLEEVGHDCSGIQHIVGQGLYRDCNYIMSNNFAFGGVNTSVIFKRYE